ncbi:MAG TPA: tetratricopeptide repeat protein [Thermoanaerobaculia bacterium]
MARKKSAHHRAPAPRVPAAELSLPKPRWTPLSLALLAPLLAVTLALTLGYLWNEDFWWYLSTGEAVLADGGIPERDPLLYTSGEGSWVHHSWLWTVLVALLHRAAGIEGVVVFGALLAAALITLVYTTRAVDRFGLVNALLAAGVIVAAHQRLCLKSEMVTWLLLVVYWRLLERDVLFTWPFSWRVGALFAGLQAAWANLHGGYPLGIFAVLAYAVGSWIERRRPWRRGAGDVAAPADGGRSLFLLVPVLLLVSLAHPSLLRGRLELLGTLAGSATARLMGEGGDPLVLEWQPVFPSGDLSTRVLWLLLAAVGLLSFRAARGPRAWPRLLLFAGLAALSATAVRHVTALAIATAIAGIANLADRGYLATEAPRRARKERSPLLRLAYPAAAAGLAVFLLMAAAGLWLARSHFDPGTSRGSFFTVNPRAVSPGAAEFLLRHRPPGPVFNDFATGGYLAWRLHPTYQFFIDSRILEPELVTEYKRMLTYPSAWREAERKYGFRTAVLGNYSKTFRSPVGEALRSDPRWTLVYLDPHAAVFVRDAGGGSALAAAGDVPAETAQVPFLAPRGSAPARLAGLASRPFFHQEPSLYLTEYLAVLGTAGKLTATEELASQALDERPGDPLLLRQRCAARQALGNPTGALADCEAAYRQRGDDVGILTLYAFVLRQQGRTDEARALLQKAKELSPGDPQVASLERALSGRRRR